MIILGAGKAERMGFPKGLFQYQDRELINWHLELCKNLNIEVALVLSSENKNQYNNIGIEQNILINEYQEKGPIFSVKLGLEFGLKNNFTSFLILPIDTLPLKNETILTLLKTSGELVLPSFQNRLGHPPKLSKKLAQTFIKEYKSINRLDLFFNNQNKTFCVVNDPNILSNQNHS